MILADVLKYVFLVVGTLIVLVSYWLAAVALFPTTVERARLAYAARPLRLTLLGAAAAVPLLIVGIALLTSAPQGPLKLLGGVIAGVPLLLGLVGSAGLSERMGRGLVHADDARTPWRRSLRGAIVLALTFLLPVIGWFVILPATLLSGCGAMLTVLRHRGNNATIELANAA